MVAVSGRDAWIAGFISMLLALVYVKIILKIAGEGTGHSIIVSAKKLSPVIGNFLGILLTVFFLMITFTYLRDFEELMNIHMTNTPKIIFAIVIMFLGVFALKQGMEVLTRVNILLILPVLSLILLGFIPNLFHLNFIPAVFHLENWKHTLNGTILQFGSFGELLVLVMVLPLAKKTKGTERFVFAPILLMGLFIAVLTYLLFGVFGTRAPFYTYKLYELFRVVGRLDSLFIILWVITFTIKVTLFLYAAVISLSDTMNLKSHQPLIFPTAILVVFLSLMSFKTYTDFLSFFMRVFPIVAVVVEFIAPLLFLIAYMMGALWKGSESKA